MSLRYGDGATTNGVSLDYTVLTMSLNLKSFRFPRSMSLRSHKMPRRIILFKWSAERDIAHLSQIKERYGLQVTMSLIKSSQVLRKVQAAIKLEGQ